MGQACKLMMNIDNIELHEMVTTQANSNSSNIVEEEKANSNNSVTTEANGNVLLSGRNCIGHGGKPKGPSTPFHSK